jgi:hypothetical protein
MRLLFVGGPWHGQVRDIPAPDYWRVPLVGRPSAEVMYVAVRVGGPLANMRVMMIDALHPYGDPQDQAEAIAAWLIAVGQALDLEVRTPLPGAAP